MTLDETNDGFLQYAMEHYKNPDCRGVEEFEEDINRIKYIKRLFGRYFTTGELKERLILNHIITFYNVFDIEPATNLLFYKMEDRFQPLLKTFLVFLSEKPYTLFPYLTKENSK